MNTKKEHTWCIVIPRMTNNESTYVFPIGVGYVCSSLKSTGRNVKTLNLNYKEQSDEDLIKNLILDEDVDVIAMGGLTSQYQQLHHIFKIAKSFNHNVICIQRGVL